MSANQINKLNNELNDYRGRFEASNEETETYRRKIQKLTSENTNLGDEIRGAQENLRLSANQIAKLNNELKITCGENEELQRRLQQLGEVNKKVAEYENRMALLSQEIERLNNVIDQKNNELGHMNNQLQ